MATTGANSFSAVADLLGSNTYVPALTLRQLKLADVLMLYVFDAIEGYTADGTNYPGGKTITSLDAAIFFVGTLASNSTK